MMILAKQYQVTQIKIINWYREIPRSHYDKRPRPGRINVIFISSETYMCVSGCFYLFIWKEG